MGGPPVTIRQKAHSFLGWLAVPVTTIPGAVAALGGESVREKIWQAITAVAADPVGLPVSLAVLAAWGLAWVWTGRPAKPPRPQRIPLYQGVRWLAQHSAWAAQYRPDLDDRWVTLTDTEIQSALALSHVRAWGFYKPRIGESENVLSEIPAEFWRKAQWNSHHMVLDEPPTHIWRDGADGGGSYRRVVLDKAEVETVWPKRSRWAAFRKQSPIERIGGRSYGGIWDRQDAHYASQIGRPPFGLFEGIFGPANSATIDRDAEAEDRKLPAPTSLGSVSARRDLITSGRDMAHAFTARAGGDSFGFRAFLEGRREYADLKPHLSEGYLAKLHRPRTSYAQASGAAYPTLVAWFLEELERLEREWGLL